MRMLQVAVVVMGVLIVAGVVTIAVTIVNRATGGAATAVAVQGVLDEPDGTRIAGTSLAGDRLAVQLQGGGADRVVVLDTRSGRVVLRAGLGR